MKHDAVCPPEKTKISPGSVFLIMYVLIFLPLCCIAAVGDA